MAAALITGAGGALQGARLARQSPGALPVESGTKPAVETPAAAAKIQRSLGVLGTLNIAAGVAAVAINAVIAQAAHNHPPKQRTLARVASTDGTSPLWVGFAIATAGAALDQARRRFARSSRAAGASPASRHS
jgi:hypothetical protein